ncbi:hypothetical protein LZY01_20650 [Levilactobacillus zymae]|uniref:HTH tetR-type domain-containing protein n=1 Tax=Levilactobacillus zymae TaxID=267363 RepID=A0ABQ0X3K9_9LACO|nr:TetR/AcrR family transcriptional regulator [Levilactobacillus zymae]KRL12505.1 hypothetical protein FD38_GL001469 [Levilactobacillus zymae DSM 19395]QFR61666.1 TetR family transcriptional regulator [Levilactobacillus zymae]GEO72897.1 hypothetical protein LZY01_20650 [Levilactobacillus zymae]
MDTRKLILHTAYELFKEKSYEDVSVTDICNACRLTKPAFYYHFSSKSDLLLHYYDNAVDQISLQTKEKSSNYWQQLVSCFVQLIEAGTGLGVDITSQLFIANLTENKGSFDFNQRFSEICIELITKAQKVGQIRNQKSPADLFVAASVMFTGYAVFWAVKNADFDRVKNVVASLEVVFDVPEDLRTSQNDICTWQGNCVIETK